MTLSASIKHQTPGRIRLQVTKKNFDQAALREVVQSLQSSSSLRRVRANPVTRSIVLEAENDEQLQSALKEVADAHVIHLKHEVEKKPEVPQTLRQGWTRLCEKTDEFLRESSDGRLDLRTAISLTLASLGAGQMVRGKFLPAGMTLVMYAIGNMGQEGDSRRKR